MVIENYILSEIIWKFSQSVFSPQNEFLKCQPVILSEAED